MIEVTQEEFETFIFEQPDEREFCYSENNPNKPCGCPMVQYAREKNIEFTDAGVLGWFGPENLDYVAKFEDLYSLYDFLMCEYDYPEFQQKYTYGQLKDFLKSK